MKKIFILVAIMAMVVGYYMKAEAALELIGQGTAYLYGTNNLIYDDDLDITWYDYSNYFTNSWQEQVDWAEGLEVTFGANIYTDWRLPTTEDGLYEFGYDGTTTAGYNITTSEMGHLFYTELGNISLYTEEGTYPQDGWGLRNKGDFQNLKDNWYFSGTEYSAGPSNAWRFHFDYGDTEAHDKHFNLSLGIAVRPGLAVAPEPVSMILFVTGGVILAARRKLIRRRNR